MTVKKFDPNRAWYDGAFYFPLKRTILTVREYEDDDDCDYEHGFVSMIVGTYYIGDIDRHDDGVFYGYHNIAEYMEDAGLGTDCYVLTDYCCDTNDLLEVMRFMASDGKDLFALVREVDELVGREPCERLVDGHKYRCVANICDGHDYICHWNGPWFDTVEGAMDAPAPYPDDAVIDEIVIADSVDMGIPVEEYDLQVGIWDEGGNMVAFFS